MARLLPRTRCTSKGPRQSRWPRPGYPCSCAKDRSGVVSGDAWMTRSTRKTLLFSNSCLRRATAASRYAMPVVARCRLCTLWPAPDRPLSTRWARSGRRGKELRWNPDTSTRRFRRSGCRRPSGRRAGVLTAPRSRLDDKRGWPAASDGERDVEYCRNNGKSRDDAPDGAGLGTSDAVPG